MTKSQLPLIFQKTICVCAKYLFVIVSKGVLQHIMVLLRQTVSIRHLDQVRTGKYVYGQEEKIKDAKEARRY